VLIQLLTAGMPGMPSMPGMDMVAAAFDALPLQTTGVLRADPDHLTVQLDAVPGPGTPAVSERETELAARMPSDTLVYLEARDVDTAIGQAMASIKAALAEDEEGAAQIAQFEQLLATPLEDYFDFAEDIAVGLSIGDDGVGVGIAATVDDLDTGEDRLRSVITLARLVLNQVQDVPVTLETSEVDDVDVFTFRIGEGVIPVDVPIDPSISLAVGEDLLLIGTGDFVSEALTRDPADSLATSPNYVRALEAAGTPNGGIAYADLATAVGLVEGILSDEQLAQYQAEVMPYAQALDQLVAVLDDADGTISLRALLFVK
jgi:hypothetical protein